MERLLPWEQDSLHPDAGWKVKAKIERSTIPNAGLGRFVLEDVPKGGVLREATIVDAPSAVAAADGFKPRPGTAILFYNQEDLVSTLETLAPDGKRLNLYEQIANFGFMPEDVTGSKFDREQAVFFWVPVGYLNHQPMDNGSGNISLLLRGQESKVFVIAARDISAGEELFHDYRELVLPAWFREFCRANSLVDGISLGYKLNRS